MLWATSPQSILPTAWTPVSCTSQHESLAPSATYGLAFGSWRLISAPCLLQTFLWVHGPISSPGLCCWSWADERGKGQGGPSFCLQKPEVLPTAQMLQGPEEETCRQLFKQNFVLWLLQVSQELYQKHSTYSNVKNVCNITNVQRGVGITVRWAPLWKKVCLQTLDLSKYFIPNALKIGLQQNILRGVSILKK